MKILRALYESIPALFAVYIYFAPNVWIKNSFNQKMRIILNRLGDSKEFQKNDAIKDIKAYISFISYLGAFFSLTLSFIIEFVEKDYKIEYLLIIPFLFLLVGFFQVVVVSLNPIDNVKKNGAILNWIIIVGTLYFIANIFTKAFM